MGLHIRQEDCIKGIDRIGVLIRGFMRSYMLNEKDSCEWYLLALKKAVDELQVKLKDG